jgi:hypothetical protein
VDTFAVSTTRLLSVAQPARRRRGRKSAAERRRQRERGAKDEDIIDNPLVSKMGRPDEPDAPGLSDRRTIVNVK